MAIAPVERKVTFATAAAYVGSASLLGGLVALQDHGRLLEWMPDGVTPFVAALVPTAITAVSGWMAKHTPRDGASSARG
ncbi:holin [Streptomyces smyrnaeus]|uniref:holin n=1 Tax=Streptomyces smyrnaeus TaxID=1387713 RepID=UPI0036BE42D6